jgi:hypothetical protein
MLNTNDLITVLWPYDIKNMTGHAYGWRNERTIVVAGVVQEASLGVHIKRKPS